jgi:integrase/recombinase XerD
MTPLRRRMIEDMVLAGLSKGTQATYLYAIRKLAVFYQRSPETLSEEEVAAYLRDLIVTKKAARGTFQTARFAIRFIFGNTLGRDWALLKRSYVFPSKSVSPRFWNRTECAVYCV